MDSSRFRPSFSRASEARQEDLGLSRRDFLRLSSMVLAAGSLVSLPLSLSSCTAFTDRPIRYEITTVAALPDLNTFKDAVAKMKALSATDARNWSNMATLHNNWARHHNWLFLPWHRAYLYYFEQICRKLTGNTTFALSYWNWTLNPQVPAPFWDTSSSLYDGTRVATASTTMPATAVGASVINDILAEPNFLSFASGPVPLNAGHFADSYQSPLEYAPHNNVHVNIGGDMADPATSPLDAVFWTHHGRVDELWVEWNILRDNPNTNNTDWTNTEFTEFVDGDGHPVTVAVSTTTLMPLLSYRYDTQV